jgi:superfamily I DNA/RNA helicase/CRISPR/Cas system-associated exonuclease Cas4 (RecB family)
MKDLTLEQKKAIEEIEGTVCLKAGAGTGKTSVLVNRYLRIFSNLLEKGVSPEEAIESILTVTFTNKAAGEMRERLVEELGKISLPREVLVRKAYISTIDSFCTRLLRENALEIGLEPNFRVINEIEAKILFCKVGKALLEEGELPRVIIEQWLDDFLGGIYEYVQELRNKAISPSEFLHEIPKAKNEEKRDLAHLIVKVYASYEEELRRRHYFDFSGILLETLHLLKNNAQIREKYRRQFKYVLVDEYQDTTPLQDKLLRQFSHNYFVVGDTKQSIYGFRGAKPENIEDFGKESELSLSLTKNFRSFNQILKVVNKALEKEIPDYEPVSSEKEGEGWPVEIFLAESQEEEAEFIAQRILQFLQDYRLKNPIREDDRGRSLQLKDIAILLRGIKTPVAIYEEGLRRHGIPFVTTGGTGYYERPEIRDLVALLGTINNPFDDISLVRLLRSPIFRIKNSSLSCLARVFPEREIEDEEKMVRKRYPVYDALGKLDGLDIGEEEKRALKNCRALLERFFLKKSSYSLGELVYKVVSQSNYFHYAQTLPTTEKRRTLANIKKFFSLVQEFEERNIFSTLEDFITYVKEVTEQGVVEGEAKPGEENAVRLMSIHQAKGLEFPIVFLANVKDKAFPFQGGTSPFYAYDDRSLISTREERRGKRKGIDMEEKRLLYVSLTRPREKLIISGSRTKEGKLSPFISYFLDEKGKVKEEFSSLVDDRRDKFLQERKDWEKEIYPQARRKEGIEELSLEEIRNMVFSSYKSIPSYEISPPSFTVTQLATFDQCPLRYKYLYLLNLPPDPGLEREKEEEMIEESTFGTVMHKTLEEYVLAKKGGEEWSESKLMSKFRSLAKAHGITDRDIRNVYEEEAKSILIRFLDNSENKIGDMVTVEEPFHLFIDDCEVRGIIDRIDRSSGNGYHVIDYKTNRQKNGEPYVLPMVVYKWGAEEVLGYSPVEKLSLYWLRHNELITIEIGQDTESKIKQKIKTIIKKIQQEDFAPTVLPKSCEFCDYKSVCEVLPSVMGGG